MKSKREQYVRISESMAEKRMREAKEDLAKQEFALKQKKVAQEARS